MIAMKIARIRALTSLAVFLILLAPSAITKSESKDRLDIDTVRQELLRLRAEREQKRRIPPKMAPSRRDRSPLRPTDRPAPPSPAAATGDRSDPNRPER